MELCVAGLLVSIAFFVHALYLRICYFKHEAVCLDCLYGSKAFITRPLYKYELIVDGQRAIYTNRGTTVFYPRIGKCYKVLINKKNYSKVVGYAEYIVHLIAGSLFSAVFIVGLVLVF